MKIGIDARLINQTGVGVYIRNLLRNLARLAPKDFEFNVYVLPNDTQQLAINNQRFTIRIADFHWHSFSEQFGFYDLLKKDKLDIMHFTYFSYPVRYRKKFVMTIHDLIPYHFKTGEASTQNRVVYNAKHIAYKYVIRTAINNAKKIIVPTHAVETDITNTFGPQYQDKIAVTYEGLQEDMLRTKPRDLLKVNITKPFFLYVGNFYPHKNVKRLIEAFSQFASQYMLILVGPNDFFAKKLQQEKPNYCLFLKETKTEDLIYLYKNAQALVHPSLSEGFGLPVLEASYFGTPVIASNIPAFKEILDNHYISFDPNSTPDIITKLQMFIQKESDIIRLDKETLLEKFSFRNMTEQTIEIYQKCL